MTDFMRHEESLIERRTRILVKDKIVGDDERRTTSV